MLLERLLLLLMSATALVGASSTTSGNGGQRRVNLTHHHHPIAFSHIHHPGRVKGSSSPSYTTATERRPWTSHLSPYRTVGHHHNHYPCPMNPTTRSLLHPIPRGGAMPFSISLDYEVAKASLSAVAELLVACGIGAFATRKGALDKTVVASLAKVVYSIFLPALLVVNVSRTVASRSLWSLLPLPLFAWIQIIICAIVSHFMCKLAKVEPNSLTGREIRVCGTFGNSGVLPLLFSNVILRSHPNPDLLPLAVSYVSFYLLGWSPVFWTFGYSQLAPNDQPPIRRSVEVPKLPLKQRIKDFIADPPAPVQRILSPPIIGSLMGLFIGVTPLKRLLVGPGAPFSTVTNAFETIGKAYAPTALLILAGSLALPAPKMEEKVSPTKKLAVISLTRFIICPILFLGILHQAISRKLIPFDPLIIFVLFLESCMPSAQNLVIIHSLNGRPEAATKLARVLLFVYMLSCIPLTILLTVFMQYVKFT